MIYAVIDTNVLVSALLTSNPFSATRKVFDMLPNGKIIPLYNIEVLAEYNEVLKRSKFHFDTKKVDRIIKFIEEHGVDWYATSVSSREGEQDWLCDF